MAGGATAKSAGIDGRAAFMTATRELLSENGGSRFSLAEVAARAGLNIALVSYYFGGKEQMLIAVLDEDEEAVLGPIQWLRDAELPAERKLEMHIAGMVELMSRRPYLNVLIHELLRRSGKTVGEDIASRFVRPIIALQAALLAQGKAEGVFRDVDPFAFYLNVMGGIDMLFSARATIGFGFGLRMDDADLRERFVQETVALVMDGARARS